MDRVASVHGRSGRIRWPPLIGALVPLVQQFCAPFSDHPDHPGAKREKVPYSADCNDPRTTGRYNRRRGALEGSPAYDTAASMAEQ